MAELPGDVDHAAALVQQQRGEAVAQVIGARRRQFRGLERVEPCPLRPQVVPVRRPRAAVERGDHRLAVAGPPREQAPLRKVAGQRVEQPHRQARAGLARVHDESPVVDVLPRQPARLLRPQPRVGEQRDEDRVAAPEPLGLAAGVLGAEGEHCAADRLDRRGRERTNLVGPRHRRLADHALRIRDDPPGLGGALQDAAEQRDRLPHRGRRRPGRELLRLPPRDHVRVQVAQRHRGRAAVRRAGHRGPRSGAASPAPGGRRAPGSTCRLRIPRGSRSRRNAPNRGRPLRGGDRCGRGLRRVRLCRARAAPQRGRRDLVGRLHGDHGRLRDIAPRTGAGRALAAVVMLCGISTVALITAALTQRFVLRDAEDDERATLAPRLDAIETELRELRSLLEDRRPRRP